MRQTIHSRLPAAALALGALLLGLRAPAAAAQEPGGRPWPDSVKSTVLQMAADEQAAREAAIPLVKQGAAADSAAAARVLAREDSVARASTARLEEIVRVFGGPRRDREGRDVAGAAFLLVQNARGAVGFQKAYLAFLKDEFDAGRAPGAAVADLTDRVREAEGKPQLYGTQLHVENGKLVVDPLEDPEGVDERREKLGLSSMEDYVEQVRKAYGLAGGGTL